MSLARYFPLFKLPGNPKLNSTIANKREFRELQTASNVHIDSRLRPHQEIVRRFMSTYTGLLVVQDTGTGKTRLSIGTAESLCDNGKKSLKRAIVIVPNDVLERNWKAEIVSYDPKYASRKVMDERYFIETRERFGKQLEIEERLWNKDIVKKEGLVGRMDNLGRPYGTYYDDTVIIFDEVHLATSTGKPTKTSEVTNRELYNVFHSFFHQIQGCRVLLLTATPMVDLPSQINFILNFILPMDSQLPVTKELVDTPEDLEVFRKAIVGRVSFYRGQDTKVGMKYMINDKFPKKTPEGKLKIYVLPMSKFQSKKYLEVFESEKGEKEFGYTTSSKAMMTVWPNKSVGKGLVQRDVSYFVDREVKSIASSKVVYTKKGEVSKRVVAKIFKRVPNDKVDEDAYGDLLTIDEPEDRQSSDSRDRRSGDRWLGTYSAINGFVLNEAEKMYREKISTDDKFGWIGFYYCENINYGGVDMVRAILNSNGWTEVTGYEKDFFRTKGKKYATVIGYTKQKTILFDMINDRRNYRGDYCSLVIGSKAIGVGINIRNVRSVYIGTPWWNMGRIDQAIGRGIRSEGHVELLKLGWKGKVEVYQLCAVPVKNNKLLYDSSVFWRMWKTSERKDIPNRARLRIIKETAFDCFANHAHNTADLDKNDPLSRDCDYSGKCVWDCLNGDKTLVDMVLPIEDTDAEGWRLGGYDQNYVAKYKETVREFFRTSFSANFAQLQSLSESVSYDKELRKALDELGREVLYNKWGQLSSLVSGGDVYALVPQEWVGSSDFTSSYWANLGLCYQPSSSNLRSDGSYKFTGTNWLLVWIGMINETFELSGEAKRILATPISNLSDSQKWAEKAYKIENDPSIIEEDSQIILKDGITYHTVYRDSLVYIGSRTKVINVGKELIRKRDQNGNWVWSELGDTVKIVKEEKQNIDQQKETLLKGRASSHLIIGIYDREISKQELVFKLLHGAAFFEKRGNAASTGSNCTTYALPVTAYFLTMIDKPVFSPNLVYQPTLSELRSFTWDLMHIKGAVKLTGMVKYDCRKHPRFQNNNLIPVIGVEKKLDSEVSTERKKFSSKHGWTKKENINRVASIWWRKYVIGEWSQVEEDIILKDSPEVTSHLKLNDWKLTTTKEGWPLEKNSESMVIKRYIMVRYVFESDSKLNKGKAINPNKGNTRKGLCQTLKEWFKEKGLLIDLTE